MNKTRKGFTLAEVLLTLTVVGIVASMTIPALIANTNKDGYVVALKKFYAVGNQALQQMAADNGCVGDLKCTGLFSYTVSSNTFGDAFAKYFNVKRNYHSYDFQVNAGNDFYVSSYTDHYDGTGFGGVLFNVSNYYLFETMDGMAIMLGRSDCTSSFSNSGKGPMSQICGDITVDVNGKKGPNILGRDVFMFNITNGKGPILYPWGGADDGYIMGDGSTLIDSRWNGPNAGCNGDISPASPHAKEGWQCAGRIIEEGWQMKY